VLDVRTFGGLEVSANGASLPLPTDARARELLAWLALHPGAHGRSALAGTLRPDVPEASARKTLRTAVYELRRALGDTAAAALSAGRDAIRLDDAHVRVDAREFARLCARGELEAAVRLSRGDLLAGLDADWVLRARDEHAAELAGCLGALAERARGAGDLAQAIAWARRRLEVEPLSESAHRELVRLLAAAGDRAAALAAVDAFAARLRRELGVPPSPETRALVEEIRRGRGASAPRAASVHAALPAPLARTVRPVGREDALRRLSAAWEDARSGALRVALVSGEPGIGKTTLVGEFCQRAHAAGAAILYGRCDEEPLLPHQPFVEALERHLSSLPAPEREAWLAARGGALGRLLPGMGTAVTDEGGPAERYAAFEALRSLVEQTAAARPLVLVLDDLHWADAGTLRLLRHLARMAGGARALLALCARDAELNAEAAAAIADLRRDGPLLTLALAGLDDEAVGALVAARRGGTDPETARRLRAQTGGNPFFLDELLRDGDQRPDARPPPGVREVVGRRVARLGTATQDVLALAAVAGLEFDVGDLALAAGRDPGDVLEALDDAAASGLVAATRPAHGYAFSHALVAEALLAGLPPARRARLHLAVADALERRHPAAAGRHAAEIARHLQAAGPLAAPERIVAWEAAAARQAAAALAYEQAASHYEAALTALPHPGAPERVELLLGLGGAHDRAGHRSAARDAFRGAAELARAAGDGRLLAQAALGHGGLGITIAAADPAVVDLLEQARAIVPRDARGLRVRLRTRLAVELFYDDPRRAAALSADAVAEAREDPDAGTLAAALNGRRVVLWSPAHADERLAVAAEMVALAEAAGDREPLLQARNWRILDLLELGRVSEAAAEIDAYAEHADALGLPHYRWYVPLWRAGLALLGGRWQEAAARGEEALAAGEQADDPNAPLLVRLQRQCGLEAQRRYADMDRAWIEQMASSPPAGNAWATWLAEIDAHTGETARAHRLVSELSRDGCAALPLDANWHALCDLAEAAATLGDREAAAGLRARLAPHARLFPVVARAVACYGSAEYYLGRLAATLGRHDEAERRLQAALEHNDRIGALPRAALCLVHLADALKQRGDAARARDALAQAARRADALDMPALAATATRALHDPD
jgi:DNA-binding SARP family transcriptional activator